MIGRTISHYRIIEKLGEGGMGIVYLAEDTKLGRKVALKFLSHRMALPENERRRFIHEAQAAASLSHANISTIYEIEDSDEGPFIAMEYIDGDNLSERIDGGPLPIEDALELTIQIMKGLDQAHEQGIVHRDIKSANIMIKRNGTAKIMDFGLAKLSDRTRLTREGAAPGTVAYMSPEQAQGKEVDRRSDIWSAGAVLYEMITGRQPYAGEYEQAVIYSILNDDPVPPTSIRTGVPMELERITLKAMSKDPGERYQHADDMISDLKALKRKTADGEKTDSSVSKVSRPSVAAETGKQHHRFRAAGIAVAVIAALLIVVFVIKPLFFGSELVAGQRPIAVINFENRTGDPSYDYLSAAIPNLLITSLEQSRRLQVMTWERMQDLLQQTGREKTEVIDKELSFELCELDGIDVVVVGSYIKAGNSFAIEAKIMDVITKKLLHTASTKGDGVESILRSQIDELSRDITKDVSRLQIPKRNEPVTEITTHSMDAYNYYLIGRDFHTRFYYRDAILNLERALEIDSTFASAYLYLALVKSTLVESAEADSLITKGMHYAENAAEKDRLFIKAYYIERMKKDTKQAISILEELTRKYPKEKSAYLRMAILQRSMGQYEKAIESTGKALLLDPEFTSAINYMGYLHMDILEYGKALEFFERYAALTPGDPNPWDSMGDCLYRIGRIRESMASYRMACEIDPDFFTSKMCLSYLYSVEGDFDSALYWMDRAIESSLSPALKCIGELFSKAIVGRLGRYSEAAEREKTALNFAMESTNPRVELLIRASSIWHLYVAGKYDESLEAMDYFIDRAAELHVEIPLNMRIPLIAYRGLNAIGKEDLDEARAAVEEMDELVSGPFYEKHKVNAQHTRRIPVLLEAEVLLAEGRPAEAIAFMAEEDTMYTPTLTYSEVGYYNLPPSQDVVARAHVALGDNARAIEEYERMLTFDPSCADRRMRVPVYHYRVAVLYGEEGRHNLAAKNYERYLEIMKRADKGIAEVEDARRRLEKLRRTSNVTGS